MSNDWLKVQAENPEWSDKQHSYLATGEKTLRSWQAEAFEQLKNSRFSLVSAFCGSGKSILQIAFSIDDIISSGFKQKQLLVVPQSHLANNFIPGSGEDSISIKVNDQCHAWKVTHNYCDVSSKNVIQNLRQWLLKDRKQISQHRTRTVGPELAAITTHQALGLAWNASSETDQQRMIENLTLRIDEAHHVSGVFDLIEEGLSPIEKQRMQKEATNLGHIARAIMNSQNETAKIQLATATFFRGDQEMILSPAVQNKFDTYYLDWLEHWKTLGIERFNVEFESYGADPTESVLRNVRNEPKEKHLIVVPPSRSKWRKDGTEHQRLLQELRKLYPRDRVLDLVTKETQEQNTARLRSEPRDARSPSHIDVVVTCMIGREGMDWVPCSRLHSTAPENSITLAVQTMGRVFRRYENANGPVKTRVNICNYIPEFAKPVQGATLEDVMADRVNAILFLIQVNEMVHPLRIPSLQGERKNRFLSEIFGTSYQRAKEEFLKRVDKLEKKSAKEISAIAQQIFDEYGINENREALTDSFLVLSLRAASPELRQFGIDVKFLREQGFNQLLKKYDLERKSIFFADCSQKEWQTIRALTEQSWEKAFRELQQKGIPL